MQSRLLLVVSILCLQNNLFSMVPATYLPLRANISVLASSQDGRYVVAGTSEGKVLVVDLYEQDENGNFKVKQFTCAKQPVTAITCGSYIVIGYASGDLHVFNYNLRSISFFQAHEGPICKIAADESWVAVTTQDGLVKVFDLDKPNCLCTVEAPAKVSAIALNHYREMLVFSHGCNFKIYDIKNNSVKTFCASKEEIASCFLNDTILWFSACDGYLSAWNIVSEKEIKNFKVDHVFSSLCMNMDHTLLIGIDREKIAYVYNCATGACVEKAQPNYPHVSNWVNSGETVLFWQQGGVLEIQPIGLSCLFKNDSDYSIHEFTFVDDSEHKHTIAKECKAHDCVRLVLDFLLNRYSNYKMRMKISESSQVVASLLKLPAVREMRLTRDIEKGQLSLWLGKKYPEKEALTWVPSLACACRVQTQEADQNKDAVDQDKKNADKKIYAIAYVWGEVLKSLSLKGGDGKEVFAQKRQDSPIWDFEGIGPHKPYILSAETEPERTTWRIPYLPNCSELFIPGSLKPGLYPNLYISHEFTSQETPLIYGIREKKESTQKEERQAGKSSPCLWH